MFEESNAELIRFMLENLFSKDQVIAFLGSLDIRLTSRIRNQNKATFIASLAREVPEIKLDDVRNYTRGQWQKPLVARHIDNLKSGILKGHGWYGAMPSTLHLSLQTMIRNYVNSNEVNQDLDGLIKTGGNIMKHEYFIVAVADICENIFVEKFDDTIPSITSRGVIDFIFGGVPYDLKNSVISTGWSFDDARNDPRGFIDSLVQGADVARMRKQAKGMHENWGNNRLYVITEYEDIWLDNTEKALNYLYEEATRIKEEEPLEIKVGNGLSLLSKIIFIPRDVN